MDFNAWGGKIMIQWFRNICDLPNIWWNTSTGDESSYFIPENLQSMITHLISHSLDCLLVIVVTRQKFCFLIAVEHFNEEELLAKP